MVSFLRLGLETELRTEREQRQSLQRALQREQDNSVELRTQLQQLQGLHTVSVTHAFICFGSDVSAHYRYSVYKHKYLAVRISIQLRKLCCMYHVLRLVQNQWYYHSGVTAVL